MSEIQSSKAVLAALKGLQQKVRHLEDERTKAREEVQTLMTELARRQEDFIHTQELQNLTIQEESAASRLSYERLLSDKRVVDTRIDEIEGVKRELQEACETARNRGQDGHVAQLAAETKASILEGRINESEQKARARKERCSRARKAGRREQNMADSQLNGLAERIEILQYTLKGERASRKSADTKHRRAQSATIRTSRYLDSILKVNQEIVAATSGMHEPRPSPALLSRPRAHRATWRGGEKNGHGPPSLRVGATLGGVDVGAAVEEAVMVGRTGGDPVPTLTALYERIGFCAVQGEDGDDEGMQSLPTSPKRAVPGNTQREYGVQNRNNDEGMYRQRPGDRAGVDGFFPNDSPKELRSPTRWATGRKVDVGKSEPSDDRGGHGKGNGIKGYSFAHSPLTKVTSVAERSPEVLKRLEALASQLERERADVEQWYKEVVHRASPGEQEKGTGADLDARSLTEAIACLQEKAQQIDVVQESLTAFKASPPTPTVASPTVCRRKAAALHVLQGICHDAVGGG